MSIDEIYDIYLDHPICTDTRKIRSGCLFIALIGERFNGHDYIESAFEKGAAYCMVSENTKFENDKLILVEDTLVSLQELAAFHRSKFNIPVLAITGSNGKTTTKELTRNVLSKKFGVHATQGNLNNHIGVPLTLLTMPLNTEFAIIEMGANHKGEIKELCQIANPNCGIITNVGLAHLEGFGGKKGVQQGKKELYDYIDSGEGVFFVNGQDSFLNGLPRLKNSKMIEPIISMESQSRFIQFRLRIAGKMHAIKTNLFGDYNLQNIATAISIGRFFGVSEQNIANAIADYDPKANRSQVIYKSGLTIVLDAYNANPTSMEASISAFKKKFMNGILILGSMLELGEESEACHQKLVDWVRLDPWEEVVLVGDQFQAYENDQEIHWFLNSKEAGQWVNQQGYKNTAILLKGSRSIQLERVIEFLEDN